MNKDKRVATSNTGLTDKAAKKITSTLGRKRDHTRDTKILEAAIEVLAESGFDGLTMDAVAARAKAGKATAYRRWSSKSELVRDALIWMGRNHVELDHLPDTGNLRDDLLALSKPQSLEEKEKKLRIFAGLGAFYSQQEFAEATNVGIFEPWMAANHALMQRAIDRGELPTNAPIDMACQVIASMPSFRSFILRKSFDNQIFIELLDTIILPALKNPPSPAKS